MGATGPAVADRRATVHAHHSIMPAVRASSYPQQLSTLAIAASDHDAAPCGGAAQCTSRLSDVAAQCVCHAITQHR
jgi:hypothetical protein